MSTSSLYNSLKATATEFVHSTDMDSSTHNLNTDRILAIRTSDFQQSWGHNLFISSEPGLQGSHGTEKFMTHLATMVPHLDFVRTKVTDTFVDELRKSIVVRSSFLIKAKGVEETVKNDIVWFLEMDESGRKIRRAKEFIDSVASARLGELIRGVKE